MKRRLCLLFATVMMFTMVLGVSVNGASDTYMVKEGDFLWKIARTYDTDYETLAYINGIDNPHMIYAGQQLKVIEGAKHLTLLHTNDMHGFFIEGKYDGMGAAKLKTVIDMYKAKNPKTMVLDAGDATQGANLVTLSDGENAIEIMNALGYDAMAAGNHEFDYTKQQVLTNAGMANFPTLAANVLNEDGSYFLTPYMIKEVEGVKVAVVGLATPDTVFLSHPDNSQGLTFEDPAVTAKKLLPELETKADVIIALAHLGDDVGDYTSVKLAEQVTGFDLIIDGHSHSSFEDGFEVNGTLIVAAGEKTKNVGVIDLLVVGDDVVMSKASLFTKKQAEDIEGDAEVETIISRLQEENAVIEQEVVAKTDVELIGVRELVRTGETNLGNLITEALIDISGADVALTNGGGIRSSIDVGDITKGEVLTVLPYGNTVRVIELSGADIIAAIENGIQDYPSPKGAFPHIAGMTVEFDSTKEAGSRVVKVMIGDGMIDETKMYTMATNDYLVSGGDGYAMFKDKKVVAEFGAMDEVLIDFINAEGTAKGAITNRMVDIATKMTGMIVNFFKTTV